MSEIKISNLVLDVLKPREISIVDLSKAICGLPGVDTVSTNVQEVDVNTETISINIQGEGIDFGEVLSTIEHYGCATRSVDSVRVYKTRHEGK